MAQITHLFRELLRVGGSLDEPEQFLGDAAPKNAFRRQERHRIIPEIVPR